MRRRGRLSVDAGSCLDDLSELIETADAVSNEGWDFGRLGDRLRCAPPPWTYADIVVDRARRSRDLLDLGTGGGEQLASLPFRPRRTVATEAWPPNVPVAARRLRPLGVPVVHVAGAPDNVDQTGSERVPNLPFADGSFTFVADRNEAFVAREVARVLAPGGRFVTQQACTSGDADLAVLLALRPDPQPARPWSRALAVIQLEEAGLRIIDGAEGDEVLSFGDVGAIRWYLNVVPRAVSSVRGDAWRRRLSALHRDTGRTGRMNVRIPCFWLDAEKIDDHA